MNDLDLYKGISEKNNAAFQHLYDQHFGKIKSMVVSNSGDVQDALDIFQEAMVALWMNIKQNKYTLESNTKLSTYLYSICRNLWFKKIRDSKKVVAMENYHDKGETSEEDALDEQYNRISNLREQFKTLGDKCKKMLSMFYYEKASIREIAAAFNYEEKTAKNEKYRCMKKLRSKFN